MKISLSYVTSNAGKFSEAQIILTPFLEAHPIFELTQLSLEIEEIQGTKEQIAFHKTKNAFFLSHKQPVIIDDISLSIDGLQGLPGPYIKTFLEQLGEEGLWSLSSQSPSQSCHVTCTIGYMDNEKDGPHLFYGTIHGSIHKPRGTTRHGKQSWNSIFCPQGMNKTMGELSMEEIAQISPRSLALSQCTDFLLQHISSKKR